MSQLFMEGLRLLLYIIIFVAVLFGAKYTTEFIAKRNQGLMLSRKVKLIERVPLSKDREIILIEYQDVRYLLSTNNHSTFVIDKFQIKEEINENQP